MVRLLLAGLKTQTRRVLNPQPQTFLVDEKECEVAIEQIESDTRPRIRLGRVITRQELPYAVGDRLWVRESVARIDNSEFDQPSCWQYRADTNGREFPGDWPPETKDDPERPRLKPAIHMPRQASRLTLICNGVKVERLQNISREDAIAEGATSRPNSSGFRARETGWSMDWSRVGEFSKYSTGGPGPLLERLHGEWFECSEEHARSILAMVVEAVGIAQK